MEILFVGIFLVALVFNLFLCAFVARFAEERGHSYGAFFAISFFFSPVLGLLCAALAGQRDERRSGPVRQPKSSGIGGLIIVILLIVGGLWFYFVFLDHPTPEIVGDALSTIANATPASKKPFTASLEQQKAAVRLFPMLGVAGSPINREFLARYEDHKRIDPEFFSDSSWPTLLAQESRAALAKAAPTTPKPASRARMGYRNPLDRRVSTPPPEFDGPPAGVSSLRRVGGG